MSIQVYHITTDATLPMSMYTITLTPIPHNLLYTTHYHLPYACLLAYTTVPYHSLPITYHHQQNNSNNKNVKTKPTDEEEEEEEDTCEWMKFKMWERERRDRGGGGRRDWRGGVGEGEGCVYDEVREDGEGKGREGKARGGWGGGKQDWVYVCMYKNKTAGKEPDTNNSKLTN